MAADIGNLSFSGLVDGITATGIILCLVIVGLISFYHARKLGAKLLAVAALNMVFVGLFWLGPTTDFFHVILTGKNLNPEYYYGWLSYVWIAPANIAGFYLGGELIVPKRKWIVVGIYTVLGIIFEILLFTMPTGPTGVFTFHEHGEGDLIDTSFNAANPARLIVLILLLSVLVFLAGGFAIKAKQATGELRKKFLYLTIANIIFFVCGLLDSAFAPGPFLAILRGIMMTYGIWQYMGLKS